MRKWDLFAYTVQELLSWHEDVNGSVDRRSFTKLKLLKLLFFVSAADETEEEHSLLNIFDNFWAMPYGHVESDIYSRIRDEQIEDYTFVMGLDFTNHPADMESVDLAICKIRDINPVFINYTPNELVDLSHEWHSWKSMYNVARSLNKYSIRIPKHTIIFEDKFYSFYNESI